MALDESGQGDCLLVGGPIGGAFLGGQFNGLDYLGPGVA
jgi:hypothetical protein